MRNDLTQHSTGAMGHTRTRAPPQVVARAESVGARAEIFADCGNLGVLVEPGSGTAKLLATPWCVQQRRTATTGRIGIDSLYE